jgi:hypothetical protein
MVTKDIFDARTSKKNGVAIYGDYCKEPVCVTLSLLENFKGEFEKLYHKIKEMEKNKFLPYTPSISHLMTVTAWNYALKNRTVGRRIIQYRSVEKDGCFEVGYGKWEDGNFCFIRGEKTGDLVRS